VYRVIIEYISLFLTGILAGEEFVVRYGVRGPLATLDDRSHIQLRQGLIRTLRVLVPAVFLPAFVSTIAVAVVDGTGGTGTGTGYAFRWAGVLALAIWFLVTLFGTIPINERAYEWQLDAPPSGWKATVDRWEKLNTVRTWSAVLAFALLLTASALQQQH
jgi:uncharacterized membrane protein